MKIRFLKFFFLNIEKVLKQSIYFTITPATFRSGFKILGPKIKNPAISDIMHTYLTITAMMAPVARKSLAT